MASYDPYENRVITSKSTSNFEVIVHLVKSSFGIGVLSLPYAISEAGYVMAAAIGAPLILLALYGVHVMIRTMVKISATQERPYIPYHECMEIAVLNGPNALQRTATFAKYSVQILLLAYPLGICAGYVLFISTSLALMYSFTEDRTYTIFIYEVILLVPVYLVNCLPNLHRMTLFSATADLLTFAAFSALLYFIFGEKPHISGEHYKIGDYPLHIPMFIGVVLFALEAISVVLSLEERMKKPRSFLGFFGLYNIGMSIVISIYILIGVSGYLKYGDDIYPSVHMNLPDTWVSFGIKLLFIVIIYLSYPIQCYPVIAILWEQNLSLKYQDKKKKLCMEYLFRFEVTALTVAIAVMVPKFDVMITLVGAICISTLGLFVPAYLEFLYTWTSNNGRYNWTMIKDILMMAIGLLILVGVVVVTIADEIIELLEENEDERKLHEIRLMGL